MGSFQRNKQLAFIIFLPTLLLFSLNAWSMICKGCLNKMTDTGSHFVCEHEGCIKAGKPVTKVQPLAEASASNTKDTFNPSSIVELCENPDCKAKMVFDQGFFICPTCSSQPSFASPATIPADPAISSHRRPDGTVGWKEKIFKTIDENLVMMMEGFHAETMGGDTLPLNIILNALPDSDLIDFLKTVTSDLDYTTYRTSLLKFSGKVYECPVEEVEIRLKSTLTFQGCYLKFFGAFRSNLLVNDQRPFFDLLISTLRTFKSDLPAGSIEKMLKVIERHPELELTEPLEISDASSLSEITSRIAQGGCVVVIGTYLNYYQCLYIQTHIDPSRIAFTSRPEVATLTEYTVSSSGLQTHILTMDDLNTALPNLWLGLEKSSFLLLTHGAAKASIRQSRKKTCAQ